MTDGAQAAAASPAPLIVGIGGSPGPRSSTARLMRDVLALTAAAGARTEVFDGDRLARLPIFTTHGLTRNATTDALVESVRRADAVVIATPGYHGAMSGLVKNALDHLELLREDERPYLEGRAVGVIVCSAGWQACGTALVSARSAVHALRGWPTPLGAAIRSTSGMFRDGHCSDDASRGQLELVGRQVVEFARLRKAAPSILETGPVEGE